MCCRWLLNGKKIRHKKLIERLIKRTPGPLEKVATLKLSSGEFPQSLNCNLCRNRYKFLFYHGSVSLAEIQISYLDVG